MFSNTVDKILRKFMSTIEALEQHVSDSLDKAQKHEATSNWHDTMQQLHQKEASRAMEISKKLRDLIGE